MPAAPKRKTGAAPAIEAKGPMLDFLFRRLTADPRRGAEAFATVSRIAREPHWYVEGKVPDTIDGRFAVLATVTALVLVRLEREGAGGDAASVALTERFIETMEAEHRELGIGDPTLGKTVRKLVGSLSRRTDLWRSAVARRTAWADATRDSLYKGAAAPEALAHSANALERLKSGLDRAGLEEIGDGRIQ
jgi:cytochrome b pre-mRNA-processing protein 3